MTNAEMGEALDREIDESIGYWFNNDEKSYFLNKAVTRFRDKAYERFEVDEEARNKLRLLVVDSAPQVGAVFSLSAITDLTYPLRLYGNFTVACAGGDNQTVKRRITPVQLDDVFEQDAFGTGTNTDPKYEEVDNELRIKSTTAPSSVTLTYLKAPTVIDIDATPDAVVEIPSQFHNDIVDLARDICLENMNSPRYGTSVNDTVTQT